MKNQKPLATPLTGAQQESINRFRIHPGLGIARVGNSTQDFFVGPEAPGWNPVPQGGGYKDDEGLIKRQAARFRIYEYDPSGAPIGEVTSNEARVTWSVHLANKKGSWYQFVGRDGWQDPQQRVLRNLNVDSGIEPNLRSSLIIDPGSRSIEGKEAGPVVFDQAAFLGHPVELGELRTDSQGRLLVLGGDGSAISAYENNPVTNFVNNDGWCDTISDGWVEATVHLPNGDSFVAERAWVIVAPPAFAPQLQSLVTLDDLMQEVSQQEGWVDADPQVCFYRDIYPILKRACDLGWVSGPTFYGHGAGKHGNFIDADHLKAYSDNSSDAESRRQRLFKALRAPNDPASESANLMPLLYGTGGVDEDNKPRDMFALLPSQYAKMRDWSDGKFVLDKPITPIPLEQYAIADQPKALDRSALEFCAGGPFYPGIEISFIAAEAATWRAPYRINAQWLPGDVTKWMAVPWQSDFYECTLHWWPIQRPDTILTEDDFNSNSYDNRKNWVRGLPESSPKGNNDMVTYWSGLGFILPSEDPNGATVFVERARSKKPWPDVV